MFFRFWCLRHYGRSGFRVTMSALMVRVGFGCTLYGTASCKGIE